MMKPFLFLLAFLLALPTACRVVEVDDDDGSSSTAGSGGMGDGKYHPAPNGTRISEMEACERLKTALEQRATKLNFKCTATTLPICPNLLRRIFNPACMEYDEGSVDGCVEFYGELLECSELNGEGCMVTPYPGSEPAGCP